MTRRCSHCSNNGHNSRTCPTRAAPGSGGGGGGGGGGGVRLFGVRLTDGSFMKKSASMGNLSLYSSTVAPTNNSGSPSPDPVRMPDGYLSDDPNNASCSSNRRIDRKKGKPWSEEEHRRFLVGLEKLGKGDWRGISRNYVVSRTPTQVASHAQKYFIRQSNATRRKRRSSLFDMVPDMLIEEELEGVLEEDAPAESNEAESSNINNDNHNNNPQPFLDLSLGTEAKPMEATSTEEFKAEDEISPLLPSSLGPTTTVPASFLPIPPYPPFWAQSGFRTEDHLSKGERLHQHQVLKPTPILRKEPVNVDELVGMSRLNLSNETKNGPQLSLGNPSRQSAFHASAPSTNTELNEGKKSVIQAV